MRTAQNFADLLCRPEISKVSPLPVGAPPRKNHWAASPGSCKSSLEQEFRQSSRSSKRGGISHMIQRLRYCF